MSANSCNVRDSTHQGQDLHNRGLKLKRGTTDIRRTQSLTFRLYLAFENDISARGMISGNAIFWEMLESGVAQILRDDPQVHSYTCILIMFQI